MGGASGTFMGQTAQGSRGPSGSSGSSTGAGGKGGFANNALAPAGIAASSAPSFSSGGQPSIYDTASGAYNQGTAAFGNVGNMTGAGRTAQSMFTTGGQVGANFGAGVNGLSASIQPSAVNQSMNQYLNPYQQQVIGNTIGRGQEMMDRDLNNIRGQAAQAGAFGGARHGLVESELMDNYNRNMTETVGQLNQSGFDSAAQFGLNRINQQQAGATGLVNADIQRANLAQSGAAGLAGLDASNRNFALQGANGLINSATTGVSIGNTMSDRQATAGTQQQMLNQELLGRSDAQFQEYANRPQQMLDIMLAAAGGSPLNAQQTSTQKTTPGLFDYLSLGAGLGSSYLGG